MRKLNLEEMNVNALVQLFADICVSQDTALLGSQISRFNRLYEKMDAVRNELKRRDGDQRNQLMHLFAHPNIQVRLQAARCCLAVAPVEARQQIETISESEWYPQAGDAGMCIQLLDDGFFKPK